MVMIDEAPNAKLVKDDIFAERQSFADQISTALPQGIVEAFDVSGFAGFLANGTMTLGR